MPIDIGMDMISYRSYSIYMNKMNSPDQEGSTYPTEIDLRLVHFGLHVMGRTGITFADFIAKRSSSHTYIPVQPEYNQQMEEVD